MLELAVCRSVHMSPALQAISIVNVQVFFCLPASQGVSSAGLGCVQVKIVERARQLGEDPSKGAGTYDWGACG